MVFLSWVIDPLGSRHKEGMSRSNLRSLPRPAPEAGPDEALFEEWLPVVLRWCARLGGPKVDPEDAAHDVMVTVFTRLHTLRNPDDFPAWVFGITRRTLAWHRRKAWVRRWVPGLQPEGTSPGLGPEADVASGELGQRVQQVMEVLPADLREVLVLCDLEERTDDAVAQMLGIPSGTVKSRLRRARQRFLVEATVMGLGDHLGVYQERP